MSSAGVMIWPPPGKSGPGTYCIRAAVSSSGLSSKAMQALATSVRLCGGISVARPTAMPEAPLSSTMGRRAGSKRGSSKAPS